MATWSKRSPSSSMILASSPESIASRSSYVSSSRYGRSDSCVCSRSHGQPPGARSLATTSKIAPRPGEKVGSVGSDIDSDFLMGCHRDLPSGFVELGHLAQQRQQVVLPTLGLPAHLDAVGKDRDPARHPP